MIRNAKCGMVSKEADREIVRMKLAQAWESLEEAKTLLVQDAEVHFVMNSLYYAFLYLVLGLLQTRGITAPMQSTAISLFAREFVEKGDIDGKFLNAIRKAFEIRPACACEGQKQATHQDVEELLPVAEDFLVCVRRIVE